MGGEPEQSFERNMPMEAAIVAKNEFVEIGVRGAFGAARDTCRGSIASSVRKGAMNPWQDDMSRHLADDARIVPVVDQSRIGRVAIGDQRSAALHIGSHEGFDRRGGIVGDHGEADAARARIEIFRVLASRLGLIDVAIDHLDGADDEDFSGVAGLEECIAFAERDFRLIDLDDAFQWFAIWIDHRSPQLLRQQPSGLVSDAELVLQLPRRHAVGMRRHEMRGPEPRRQRQFGAVHRRPRRDRGLSAAVRGIRISAAGFSTPPRGACRSRGRRNRPASAA